MAALKSDLPSIKVESTLNGPAVKQESDSILGAANIPADEDIYEDAGDLDFTNADQQVYLTRLPKFLWETWSQLDDDQEVQVGTLRVEGAQGGIKRVRVWSDVETSAPLDIDELKLSM